MQQLKINFIRMNIKIPLQRLYTIEFEQLRTIQMQIQAQDNFFHYDHKLLDHSFHKIIFARPKFLSSYFFVQSLPETDQHQPVQTMSFGKIPNVGTIREFQYSIIKNKKLIIKLHDTLPHVYLQSLCPNSALVWIKDNDSTLILRAASSHTRNCHNTIIGKLPGNATR